MLRAIPIRMSGTTAMTHPSSQLGRNAYMKKAVDRQTPLKKMSCILLPVLSTILTATGTATSVTTYGIVINAPDVLSSKPNFVTKSL